MGRKNKDEKPDSRDAVLHVVFLESRFQQNLQSLGTSSPKVKPSDPAFFIYETTDGKLVAGNWFDNKGQIGEILPANETSARAAAKHLGNTKVHHNIIKTDAFGRSRVVGRGPKYQAIPVHAVDRVLGFVSYEEARSGKTLTGKKLGSRASVEAELELITQREKYPNRFDKHAMLTGRKHYLNATSILSPMPNDEEDDLKRKAVNDDFDALLGNLNTPSKLKIG